MIPFDLKEAMESGFFISGTTQTGKTVLAKQLISALMHSGVSCYVLDTSQAWLREDSPIQKSITVLPNWKQLSFSGNTVFDLSKIGLRDRVRFVNIFCGEMVKKHVNGNTLSEFVLFEESQAYMPNGSFRMSIKKNPVFDGVVDLVTVGGNYGLRFGVITQFPSLIDKNPVKCAQQRYFGTSTEPYDFDYVKRFLRAEDRKTLATLGKLEFLYQNRGTVQKFKVQPQQPISIKNDSQDYEMIYEVNPEQFNIAVSW